MSDCAYSQDELHSFYRLLDCIVREVAERELQLSVFDMINRLFAAADLGTRDPESLRKAILKDDAIIGRTGVRSTPSEPSARVHGRRLFLVPNPAEAA